MDQANRPANFFSFLPPSLEIGDNPVERRLLKEYGSAFVARGGATPPSRIVYRDQAEVDAFQATLDTRSVSFGAFALELQSTAMKALESAVDEANSAGLTITPRGPDSAKRSYDETVDLWKSRVEPALDHWVAEKRLSTEEADRIASMKPFEQVQVVLDLEENGIYFAKDLSKSILYSVAPPGTSQHLAMLAFDVSEFNNQKIRSILARNRWYQTVVSDLPHFTFLGVDESELPSLGLKKIVSGDRHFWVPDI